MVFYHINPTRIVMKIANRSFYWFCYSLSNQVELPVTFNDRQWGHAQLLQGVVRCFTLAVPLRFGSRSRIYSTLLVLAAPFLRWPEDDPAEAGFSSSSEIFSDICWSLLDVFDGRGEQVLLFSQWRPGVDGLSVLSRRKSFALLWLGFWMDVSEEWILLQ